MEEGGFEPPRAFTPLSVFETDPFSQTWVFLQAYKINLVPISRFNTKQEIDRLSTSCR